MCYVFELTCAVIEIKIDSVNGIALSFTTNITKRDFKSEYLLRMCSVAIDLVTSLEFNPIRFATTMCHFRRTRNGYVATHFILLCGTAVSSATSGYVVVTERCGQNEKPASTNEERTRKKPNFVTSSRFNQCKS